MPFKLLNQNHRLLIIASIVCTSSNVMYCTTCTPAKCFILVRSEKLGDSLGDVKNINKDAFRSQSLKNIIQYNKRYNNYYCVNLLLATGRIQSDPYDFMSIRTTYIGKANSYEF